MDDLGMWFVGNAMIELSGRTYFLGNLLSGMEADEGWEERGGQENLYTVQFNLFLVLHGVIM